VQTTCRSIGARGLERFFDGLSVLDDDLVEICGRTNCGGAMNAHPFDEAAWLAESLSNASHVARKRGMKLKNIA
jgi:hypothetical protein